MLWVCAQGPEWEKAGPWGELSGIHVQSGGWRAVKRRCRRGGSRSQSSGALQTDKGGSFHSATLLPGMWIKVLALWPPPWVMRMKATAGEGEGKLCRSLTLEGQVSHRQVS